MKLEEFLKITANSPIVSVKMMEKLGYESNSLRRQLHNWREKGYVVKLKKGLYASLGIEKKKSFSSFHVASILYGDNSYISLESALSYYGLIPEAVYNTISVSTSKTKTFETDLSNFIYKHVKKELFDYFLIKKDEYSAYYRIAEAEKALLDYIYLKYKEEDEISEEYFDEALRLQNYEVLDIAKLEELESLFKIKKISQAVKVLTRMIKNA